MPASSLRSSTRLRFWLAIYALLLALAARAQTPVARQIRNTGPNATRVNIAILGDGYTAEQQEQFFSDAQRKLEVLVNNESFAACKDVVNCVAIFTASNESGTDVAADGIARDTYYDTGFSGAINARLLTLTTSAGRTRAQTILREHAPDNDLAIVLVNTLLYGGAGGSPTVASLHASSDEVLLHEIGHSFAKLTDEYVDAVSAPSYPPAEFTNATQKTARAEIPWRDFLLDTTPVPTTAASTDANLVGLWEGAHYRATGFYRPIYDSKMRSLNRPFGPVNLRAFANALHRLNLNGATAAPGNLALSAPGVRASAGGALSLAVSAEGTGPLTYQWSFNGKFMAGQTGSTLALSNVSAAHLGTYSVGVTNAVGAADTVSTGITARIVTQGAGTNLTYEIQIGTQPVVRWNQLNPYISEENGSVVLALSRTGSLSGALSVAYTTAPGTATSPADFAAQTGTVTWADGDGALKTITIPIVADNSAEGFETFTVTLSNPSVGIIAENATTTVTLADPGARDPAFNANFVNSSVNRILPLPGGSLLIAGFFNSLQDAFGLTYSFGRIARLKSDGLIDPAFKPGTGADGAIYALARQPDGKILVGGDFTNYDGTARSRLARLNADGSLDASFNPGAGADRAIYDLLLLPDGKILVAGGFTTMNGTPREYVARLNPDGSLDAAFTGPDFGGATGWWVRSLALLPDGRLLVAGVFFFAGTPQRASLCRLHATGSLDSTFDGIVQGANAAFTGTSLGELRQITVLPDGKLLICGTLIAFNQVSRRGIARLSASGALDTTFDPGTGGDQPVDTFLVQPDGKVVIGGRFTTFNGVPASRLARLNADGSLDSAFLPAGGPGAAVITLVAQPDGNVLFGAGVGQFQGSALSRPVWRFLSGTPVTSGSTTPITPETPNTPVASAVGRLINLSIRVDLSSGTDSFTLGVVIGGAGTSGSKPLLVRAAGPSLAAFGLTGVVEDPRLEFFTGSAKVGENDNWGGAESTRAVMAQVGAFPFAGPASRDAALSLPGLASGANSARISGSGPGTVIAELYDATPPGGFTAATPRLVNVSVLKHIGSGLTAGFVIGGSTARTVLVRAIGPTLGAAPFNVPDVVANPQLALFAGQAQMSANDNWGGTSALSAAFTQVGAFALPANSRDAALLVTLQPGSYTAQVSGAGGSTGTALVEVYEVP